MPELEAHRQLAVGLVLWEKSNKHEPQGLLVVVTPEHRKRLEEETASFRNTDDIVLPAEIAEARELGFDGLDLGVVVGVDPSMKKGTVRVLEIEHVNESILFGDDRWQT